MLSKTETKGKKVANSQPTAVTRRTRSHTIFDGKRSDNESPELQSAPIKEEGEGGGEMNDDDDDDDDESSDDDAPEEESLSTAKQTEMTKIKQQKQIELARQSELKKQRKSKELKSIQRKKEKEERNRSKLEFNLRQTEEIPDTLPIDLLESYEESKSAQLEESIKPKKTKFIDEEEDLSIMQQRRLKQSQIQSQLKQARNITKNITDKGPVRVKVIEKRNRLLSVPVSSIDAKKDKWLKRKSLGRN